MQDTIIVLAAVIIYMTTSHIIIYMILMRGMKKFLVGIDTTLTKRLGYFIARMKIKIFWAMFCIIILTLYLLEIVMLLGVQLGLPLPRRFTKPTGTNCIKLTKRNFMKDMINFITKDHIQK